MTNQSCNLSPWRKAMRWSSFSLACSAFLLGCGGGSYDGGSLASGATPTPTEAPIATPEPTAAPPTPEPITKTDPKQMEFLDRGLIAVTAARGNALSWRLLATDNPAIAFDVYKNGNKLNESPIENKTFFLDTDGQSTDSYHVVATVDGSELSTSKTVSPWGKRYLGIPLNKPDDQEDSQGVDYSYSANDASAADLDGDGQYEIIVKWLPSNARDNGLQGETGPVIFDAYTLEGKQLWRINLGPNINAGPHYNPYIVYDFDGDGRAELAVKTADGTVDGRGKVIGDPDARYANNDGNVLDGPEFLTMFDGLSGEALDTVDYTPPRGNVADWGDTWGNRVDRFLAGVAYLDGEKPSLLMSRGYYTRAVIAAYDWADNTFTQRWVFDSDNGGDDAAVYGQGAHSLSIADVDADGKDEIIFGAATIDDNGSALYSTNLCHGDALHVGDLDPNRPGLEVFMVHETPSCYSGDGFDHGVEMHDAATGEILWSRSGQAADIGRGVSIDVDPRYPGNENWGTRGGLVAADGTQISDDRPAPINFASWWDGDLQREMLDGTTISKWNYLGDEEYTVLDGAYPYGAVSNNGTKATPALSADLLGDWREEVIWPNSNHRMLLLFSTTHDTDYRYHTLMHDSQYRTAIAWQNVGYNQPPHPSFYIGPDAPQVWEADIKTTEGTEWAKLVAQGNDDNIEVRVYINGFDVSGVSIMRSEDPLDENPAEIGTLAADERVFVDETAVPDTTYYYWAELSGSTAQSDITLDVSQTQLTSTLLPSFDVDINSTVGNVGPLRLSWETQNIAISAINIYRAETSDPSEAPNLAGRSLVGTPGITATEWIDDSGVKDAKYFYWVAFVDETAGETYESKAFYGENLPVPIIELTPVLKDGTIEISWRVADFRPEVASLELYRNITGDTQSGRVRILPNAPLEGTYTDNIPPTTEEDPGPPVPGENYWYTLKIVLSDGSRPAVELLPKGGITIPEDEAQPIIGAWAELVTPDPYVTKVSWKSYGIEAANIEIFRDTTPEGTNQASVGTAELNADSYTDTSATAGQTYTYWVVITDTEGTKHTAATGAVSLPPERNLSSQQDGANILVSWDLKYYPNELTSIELYRNTKPSTDGRTRIATGLAANGSFVDEGPFIVGQEYYYMFKLNGGNPNTDPEAPIVYIEPGSNYATNLSSTLDGANIQVSWNLENFSAPFTSIELYRNDKEELGGRTRIALDLQPSGTFTDTGPFESGTIYYYMFKINGGNPNTDPEAPITYSP